MLNRFLYLLKVVRSGIDYRIYNERCQLRNFLLICSSSKNPDQNLPFSHEELRVLWYVKNLNMRAALGFTSLDRFKCLLYNAYGLRSLFRHILLSVEIFIWALQVKPVGFIVYLRQQNATLKGNKDKTLQDDQWRLVHHAYPSSDTRPSKIQIYIKVSPLIRNYQFKSSYIW